MRSLLNSELIQSRWLSKLVGFWMDGLDTNTRSSDQQRDGSSRQNPYRVLPSATSMFFCVCLCLLCESSAQPVCTHLKIITSVRIDMNYQSWNTIIPIMRA